MIDAREGSFPFRFEWRQAAGSRTGLIRDWREPVGMGLVEPDQSAQGGDQAAERLAAATGAGTGTGR